MAPRHVVVDRKCAGERLDRFLGRHVPGLSAERAQALLAEGRVRIRGKLAKPTRKLWGGEEVELDLPPPRAIPPVDGPSIPVLFDHPAFLIVDKPRGLVVEPGGPSASLVELVASQHGSFDVAGLAAPGVVHRLDKDTTGCVLLARTDAAVLELEAAFAQRRIAKRYAAVVLGTPPDSARIETPYARLPGDSRRYTTRVPSARRAALSYVVQERFAGAALLQVSLETGRTHQIRVQLADAGFPVLGDPLYGPDTSREHPAGRALGRQALHAARLTVSGVAGLERVEVDSPLPEDFERALRELRAHAR